MVTLKALIDLQVLAKKVLMFFSGKRERNFTLRQSIVSPVISRGKMIQIQQSVSSLRSSNNQTLLGLITMIKVLKRKQNISFSPPMIFHICLFNTDP